MSRERERDHVLCFCFFFLWSCSTQALKKPLSAKVSELETRDFYYFYFCFESFDQKRSLSCSLTETFKSFKTSVNSSTLRNRSEKHRKRSFKKVDLLWDRERLHLVMLNPNFEKSEILDRIS
eukprot:Lithocolla_globosa_v1_NODE_419_length_4112_cov_8.573330.p2 type:complete len:122 gc:universal NODE_419_length_4112_cov_8.573330:2837-3202(+)